jgi:hypothetical protein
LIICKLDKILAGCVARAIDMNISYCSGLNVLSKDVRDAPDSTIRW